MFPTRAPCHRVLYCFVQESCRLRRGSGRCEVLCPSASTLIGITCAAIWQFHVHRARHRALRAPRSSQRGGVI
eukprot:8159566-Pyramimonas_sp.AAC.1